MERLRSLRPIDDDLKITECQTQKDMKRLGGARSICLDAYGIDSTGKKYDLEIQRADKGADPHRARFHSSVMDIENLDAGQEFHELPETFTIFITEEDFYGKGEPVYYIERINVTTGEPFADGEHIFYVNGEYRGDSEIGKLMHDFSCENAGEMKIGLLAERTRYLKENPKGVSEMCKVIEEMIKEEREEEREETTTKVTMATALRMLEDGVLSPEKVAEYSGLSIDEVRKLQAEQSGS